MNPLTLVDPALARRVPYAFASANGVLLAGIADGIASVWARPLVRPESLTELGRFLNADLSVTEISPALFDDALKQVYESSLAPAREVADDLQETGDAKELAQSLASAGELLESQGDAPVVRLINALLSQGLRDGASDIHIEPFETRVLVRFRLDGLLRDVLSLPLPAHPVLVSRIKVMGHLDIAEKRLPQDGRFSVRLAGRAVDVRVSTLLTGYGERVVLRLLDKQASLLTLDALGFPSDILTALRGLIQRPHGILLVTGPTGSGKTTTLYAALSELDRRQKNILTVEDPIEYALDGVGQTQINLKTDLTFARALRAILRQDPDVIMIGEIRDLETAQIAVQASLTGHLVLATLHTNDAVGALARLADMGLESFLLASSLLGVLAQRLVRTLCAECRAPQPVEPQDVAMWGFDPGAMPAKTLFSPRGCKSCGGTGYRGRTGIYQLLEVSDGLRPLIHRRAGENEIRERMAGGFLRSLRQDGARWIRSGATSVEELLRVTSA